MVSRKKSSVWQPLPTRCVTSAWEGMDAYLRLADGLDFVDHGGLAARMRAGVEVTLEIESGHRAPRIKGFRPTKAHAGSSFLTGHASLEALQEIGQHPRVRDVKLAACLVPQRPVPRFPNDARVAAPAGPAKGASASGRPLLAVFDHGCPFAHLALRRQGGGTRILRLWDQGRPDVAGLGSPPQGFSYGVEVDRHQLEAIMSASTRHGAVDEQACYLMAGCAELLRRGSHGSHALGMLASELRPNGKPGAIAPLLRSRDAASAADVVFVQFPHEAMDCVSVAHLEARVLDGLRYVLHVARTHGHTNVIVSVGYESWVGPHDGSHWFPRAVDALMDEASAGTPKVQMRFITIAGNAGEQRAQAEPLAPAASSGSPPARTRTSANFIMHVPPGSEAPTFLEIWAPAELRLAVAVTPPNASRPLPLLRGPAAVAWPDSRAAMVSVVTQAPSKAQAQQLTLVRVSPTCATRPDVASAAHGDWAFEISAREPLDGVRLYIGRTHEGMDAMPRAGQAHFVQTPGARLDQLTLNGHAGACMHVVGSCYGAAFPYELGTREVAYSGTGGRAGPSVKGCMAVENGLFHPGSLGIGNFSGSVFRMSGTSVAAPMYARWIAARRTIRRQRGGSSKLGAFQLDPF